MEAFNQRPVYRLSPQALQLFQRLHRPSGAVSSSSLVASIADLSRLFTKERGAIGARYFDNPVLIAAYAAYFLPVNFAKVQILLNELPTDWAFRDSLSVLDVGSGPGTASLAVLDWLDSRGCMNHPLMQVTAIDHSKAALLEARRLWTAYQRKPSAGKASLLTSVEQVENLIHRDLGKAVLSGAPFDLIMVANCLNELFHELSDADELRAAVLERLLTLLKPDGTLMVVDPALRSTARALHRTRDRLLSDGACTVYSPCLHELSCPALAKADDWCHEERSWEPPGWIAELDEALGFIKDALKFSYVLLRKDGRTIVLRSPDTYRVVSELRVFKGEKRAWLCNERGRLEVGRLDRKATTSNADFDAWERGSLVQIDRIVRKDHGGKVSALGRLAEDSAVTIVRQPH
jgi:SAM-dependent methyltransferase